MGQKLSSKRVVRVSFFVDMLDVVLNLGVAIITGSVVMLAETLQGAVDLVTTGLLLIGLRKANRRADRAHSFGYGRELYFWALVSAIQMLVVTAGLSFYSGLQRFLHPQSIEHSPLALIVLIIGLISNSYALSLSIRRLKQQNQQHELWKAFIYSDVVETKATFILDFMGMSAAALGTMSLLIYLITGNSQFDGLGAMLIGITIALFALFLVSEIKDLLVGRSAAPEIEDDIKESTLAVSGVLQILDLRTMYIGSGKLLVNMEIDLKKGTRSQSIEQIVDAIKDGVKSKVPVVSHMQIEVAVP